MKLIDKAALVAEIEKLKYNLCPDFYEYNYDAAKVELLEKIENFIDTLETKEVDLDRAIDKWICDDAITHEDCSISDVISTAKHFFELGLKAKGE
jgi:hypothetical protein